MLIVHVSGVQTVLRSRATQEVQTEHRRSNVCINNSHGVIKYIHFAIFVTSILSPFCNEFYKFNKTGARMSDSINHMTLKLF